MRAFVIAGLLALTYHLAAPAPASASVAACMPKSKLGNMSVVSDVRCRTFCRHRWYSNRHCWRQCW